MSEKMNSIDQRDRDQVDDARVTKLTKPGKHQLKHTNCQSIPSTLMAYGHNQASASAGPSDGKHHHHHHHHHNHGHHQPHVIHRTTSESLRLASEFNCTEGSSSLSNSTSMSSGTSSSSANQPLLNSSMVRKPKTSSFQITSVTVGSKLSADNGDDSADDLDESHTDDNSRITDMENETPSFSEDTFSKEDVFFSNSALGTAPVIPTSSQYGLVIVDPDMGGVGGQAGTNLSNVHVSMTDAGINIVGPSTGKGDSDHKEIHHRNERFKVVKIESTEPFKRGRWMCMDYLDHSTLQGTENATTSSNSGSAGNSTGVTTNDSGVVMLENNSELGCEPGDTNTLYNPNMAGMMTNMSHSPGQTLQKPLMETQSQSMSNNISAVQSGILPQVSASMPNAVVTSNPQANIVNYSQQQMHQTLPNQQYQQHQQHQQQTHMQGQSQPAHFYQNNQPNQQIPNLHGATLPSNITIQNGVPSNFIAQVPQQPQAPAQSMPAVNLGMVAAVQDMNAANIVTSIPNSSMSQPASMVQAMPQNIQQSMPHTMPQSMPQQTMPQSIPQQTMPQSMQQQSMPQNMQQQSMPQSMQQQTMPQSMQQQTMPQSMQQQTMPQSMQQQTMPQSMQQQTMPQSMQQQTMPQNMQQQPMPQSMQQQTMPQSMQQQTMAQSMQQQTMPQSMQQQTMPQSMQQQTMPQSMQQTMPQVMQQTMPQSMQQTMPHSMPQVMQQSMPQNIPQSMPQSMQQAQMQQECYMPPPPTSQAYPVTSTSGMSMEMHHPDVNVLQQPGVVGVMGMAPNVVPQTISPGVDNIVQQIPPNQVPLQSIPSMAQQEGAPQMTIMSDGSSTVSTPQQTQASATTMPPQQSNDEEQATAVEADSEKVSTLALALSKSNRPAYKLYNFAVVPDDQKQSNDMLSQQHQQEQQQSQQHLNPPHFYHSQNLVSPVVSKNENNKPKVAAGSLIPRSNSLRIPSSSNSMRINNDQRLTSSWSSSVGSDEFGQYTASAVGTPPVRANSETSASGTSAVAIDNKIEQAMDLVKSHLMIAVREEVEVLKEKIAELMDRINQLELENTILKANVSQETLSQLSATMQTASAKPPQNPNTNNGPVS